MAYLNYFRGAFLVTFVGLCLAGWLGWAYSGTAGGTVSFLFIGAILAVLEISLSFDNAIVNANKLKTMSPIWRRRFLTWGILIAVFGMRIIFPLLIVVVAAGVGPWRAIMLAANDPVEYARIIGEAHVSIAGFGGAFLMMVALNYFIDETKSIHWLGVLERGMRRCGSVRGIEIAFVLLIVLIFSMVLPHQEGNEFLFAAITGLLTFLVVEVIGHVLDRSDAANTVAKGGLGAFLYLEVLDASFSFDGVIGAFALTNNLFLIAIGLGIGAMFVRSMTIMLVEKETLAEFRYLENGAFWSIFVLSLLMFAQTMFDISEIVTGLLGAVFISLSMVSSILYRRAQR